MSGIEVVGLIASIIGIVEAIATVSKALKDAKDLPPAFQEVGEKLPLVRDTLQTVEKHINDKVDEGAYQAVKTILENCEAKGKQLEEIFNAVAPSDKTSRIKRYALAVRSLGKGKLVEVLAKGMIEDTHLLVLNHAAHAATEDQIAKLVEAIKELSNMEPSLPEEESISQTHYGSGDNVAGNKYGGNHNEIKEIHGNPYFGNVTQHVYLETKTALSLSQLCVRSLAFEGMDSRPTEIKTAAAGTCSWLIQHKVYKTWESRNRSLLWIKGKPGSGKSTLLRYARDNITASPRDKDRPLVLSFFFNGRGSELQKTAEGMYRSLLCQLQSKLPEAVEALEATFKQRDAAFGKHSENWQWGPSELGHHFASSLWKALETRPVELFVDALDECGEENAQSVAEEFSSLLHRASTVYLKQFRICFTCRHYPILDLKNVLEICIERENERDISTFVERKLSSFSERTGSKIAEYISKHAEGVFLWASLVVNKVLNLDRKRTGREKIEAEVRRVPQTLDEFYSEMIQKMDRHSAELIECICFASRPLSLEELRLAITISHDSKFRSSPECQTQENRPCSDAGMLRDIQILGCGLVEHKSDSDVVQFIHQSVMDYFVEKGLTLLHNDTDSERVAALAHYRLSMTCLRYFDLVMKSELTEAQRGIRTKFPFLHYAATSWIFHATHLSDDLQYSFPWPLDAALERLLSLGRFLAPLTSPPDGTTILHIISTHGMTAAIRGIMKKERNVDIGINARDLYGRTPLSFAAQYGHRAILEILLANGANKEGTNRHIPLALAIEGRNIAIIKILLGEGAEVNHDYIAGCAATPISERSEISTPYEFEIMESLVSSGHDLRFVVSLIFGASHLGAHPISIIETCVIGASFIGALAMGVSGKGAFVIAALAMGACIIGAGFFIGDPIYKELTAMWRTPLSRAAEIGDEKVVRLLLQYKVKPDQPDKSGKTPLSRAMENNREEIVRIL
ncbi:hypothetical protein FOXYS1_14163, partial [Fusarium oxysporum]